MDEQKVGGSKKAWWILGIVIVLILIIVGVSSNRKPAETGPIKIGVVTPLTGDVAFLGIGIKAAADLAVSEINSAGGINGRQLQLIAEDGKCDAKEAVTVVTKLINIDKVNLIVGGSCSAETIAPAPIAEKAKVIMLSPSSSNPAITKLGDYIFRDYPSDAFQGVRAAEFAVNVLKAKKIAVISCMSDWCQGIPPVFKAKVAALGATIVAEENFDNSSKDLKTQLAKIKSANPDVVYFLSFTDGTVIGLKQAKEIGLNAKFLGGDAWNDPTIVSRAGAVTEGIMYLIPTSPKNPTFEAAMAKINQGKEVTIGARETYDAIKILAEIMSRVGTDSTKIKDALYKVQNYQGVSGNISFDENGDLSSASYDIKVIKDGKPVDYIK